MARFILYYGSHIIASFESNDMEPSEMAALKALHGKGRLRFERLIVDRLPDLPTSHLGLIAEEIVSQPRGRYDPRTTRNAETIVGRKAVRR